MRSSGCEESSRCATACQKDAETDPAVAPTRSIAHHVQLGGSVAKAICCICAWMFLADTTKAARALCNVYRVTRLRTR